MVKAKRKAYEVITLTPGGPTQKWIKTDLWEEKSRVVVKEEEVEKMCRDALVRQSLSLEEGLAQLEGKVADIGLEKINGSIFSVYSKMI